MDDGSDGIKGTISSVFPGDEDLNVALRLLPQSVAATQRRSV